MGLVASPAGASRPRNLPSLSAQSSCLLLVTGGQCWFAVRLNCSIERLTITGRSSTAATTSSRPKGSAQRLGRLGGRVAARADSLLHCRAQPSARLRRPTGLGRCRSGVCLSRSRHAAMCFAGGVWSTTACRERAERNIMVGGKIRARCPRFAIFCTTEYFLTVLVPR